MKKEITSLYLMILDVIIYFIKIILFLLKT